MQRLEPSLIRGFDLFGSIEDDQLRAVLARAACRRLPKGAPLFEQGAEAREFYVLIEGRLKVVQITPDGEQVVIRFVTPGEICGAAVIMGRPDYPATAIAVIDSVALVWESRRWNELCAIAPPLASNALQVVGQRLQEAHSRIRELSTEEAERRVARALLRLVAQSGRKIAEGMLIDFPVTRQDIAEMTGLTLHTVSRIMSAWEGKGLVDGGRQCIVIREAHRLFLLAEGHALPE